MMKKHIYSREILSLITELFPIEDSDSPYLTAGQVVKIVQEWSNRQQGEVTDEEITNAGIEYAKEFQLRDAPIQNDKIRSRAVRDFYQGADWYRTKDETNN